MKMMIHGGVFAVVLAAACSAAIGAEPALPKWTFQEGKQYSYDYTQETPGPGKDETIKDEGSVQVIFEKDCAKVRLTLKKTIPNPDAGPDAEKGSFITRTVTMEETIFADGSPVSPGGAMQFRDDLLFPLPRKPLYPGEVLKQEMVRAAPGFPYLSGIGQFTYVGSEVVNGLKCIHFHVSCELDSNPNPDPEQLETTAVAAEVNALFAVDAGYFISVEGTIHTRISRPIVGAAKKEQGVETVLAETIKIALRLKQ